MHLESIDIDPTDFVVLIRHIMYMLGLLAIYAIRSEVRSLIYFQTAVRRY